MFMKFDCFSENAVRLCFLFHYFFLDNPGWSLFVFFFDCRDELRKEARQLKKELLAIKQRKEERKKPEETSAGNAPPVC